MVRFSDSEAVRNIDVSAGELVVREFGDRQAPPLLFVHGALVAGSLWRDVAPALGDAYRCIVPDLPLGSHTIPMRPDADLAPPAIARLLFEILDAFDLPSATLVANDTGGAISQLAAVDRPDRIDRLVLTNCDAFEVFPPPPYGYLRLLPRFPRSARLAGRTLARFPRLGRFPLLWGPLTRAPTPLDLLADWTGPLANPAIIRDGAKLFAGVHPELTLEAGRRLGDFDRPVHLLWGDSCPFFRMSLAERLAAAAPHSELVPIAGGRCYVMLDEPQRLAAEIRRAVPLGPTLSQRSA